MTTITLQMLIYIKPSRGSAKKNGHLSSVESTRRKKRRKLTLESKFAQVHALEIFIRVDLAFRPSFSTFLLGLKSSCLLHIL